LLKTTNDPEMIGKLEKRMVKIRKEHVDEAVELLSLMGVKTLIAPSEGEATCADLTKREIAKYLISEDMDSLTFGTTNLIRNFKLEPMKPVKRKVKEEPDLESKFTMDVINLENVLNDLELTMDSFIDLCILFGCDYSPTITGVGPASAFKLIKEYSSIEKILENYTGDVPDNWNYKEARDAFKNPKIPSSYNFTTEKIDEGKLKDFLFKKKFPEKNVENAMKRLKMLNKVHFTP